MLSRGGGPAFIVEEVLLVGGMEQRAFLPSATVLTGVRLASGVEFGLGPNLTPLGTALAFAVGKSFNYGDVTFPINFAIVTSPGALRTTFLVGFAFRSGGGS